MALNDVVYNKTVDVAQSMPVPVVFAKQNENGKRKVIVTLLKNGQPFLVGTDISGYIQGTTAPNPATKQPVRFKRDLTLIDAEGNASTATFVIAESMTAEIGITQCEIALYDSTKPNEILCTANINIEVQGTGMSPQDEMASDDYQAIVSIKAEVTAMRDEVRTKTAEAIAAQGAAETAAQNAYNSALGVQKIVAGNEAYTKQEADLKYSVAPRKAQSTTMGEMRLTDADDGLAYLSLEGNSEQYTNTANKNLIDLHFATDGYSISSTGTLDKNEQYFTTGYIVVEPREKYTFTRAISISNRQGCFYNKDKIFLQPWTGDAGLSKNTVTVPENAKYLRLFDYISHKQASQLEKGNTATGYVPGAVDTPSPDYPSEVRSVGDIPKDVNGVEIRNLLDEQSFINATFTEVPNIWYSIDKIEFPPGTYLINGWIQGDRIGAGSSSTIMFSIDKNISTGNYIPVISRDGTAIKNGTMTIPEGSKGYLLIERAISEKLNDIYSNYKLMITNAAEIDEYRPYIGENNGLVKIESGGINRTDTGDGPVYIAGVNGIEVNTWTPRKIVLTQKNKDTSYAYLKLNVERGKDYTFYCKVKVKVIDGAATDGVTSIGFRQYPPGGVMYGQTILSQDGQYKDIYNTTGIIPDDVPNMAFMFYVNSISVSNGNVKMTIDDLMVVEGTKTLQEMKAIGFQPYRQQITWIPLREPLRAIKTDYNVFGDIVDKNGNVTKKIQEMKTSELTTAENYWAADASGINAKSSDIKFAYYKMDNDYKPADNNRDIPCLCNKLKYSKNGISPMIESIWHSVVIVFQIKNTRTGLSDTETNVNVIAGAIRDYVKANDYVVYYLLPDVSFSNYQIPAIYIETYEPVTNVRCMNEVKPSTMGLDYKLAISSLIKRLEALETTTVQEVTK